MSSEAARAARAAARATWPASVTTLDGQRDAADLRGETTLEERLAMLWPLTRDAWALSGKPMPDYTRAEMPTAIVRGPAR